MDFQFKWFGVVFPLIATCTLASCQAEETPSAPHHEMPEMGMNGFGANGFGPNGFGPNGFGPNGFGPNGFGPNGFGPNGFGPNGFGPNGSLPNGTAPNGILFSSITAGVALSAGSVRLDGTTFKGTLLDSTPISGAAFLGATMTETLPDGYELTIRLDGMVKSADPDITFYNVSYPVDVNGATEWFSLCGYAPNGDPVQAFPLSGYWDYSEGTPTGGSHIDDPTRFTIACRGFVLAKCAERGYKPWKSVEECNDAGQCQVLSLAPFHQACSRMLRADYCGDGKSHTMNGTIINMWDNADIQLRDSSEWTTEAEWKVGGAACVRHARLTAAGLAGAEATVDYVESHCPDRLVPSNDTECGGPSSTFYTEGGFAIPIGQRTLLLNESQAPPAASDGAGGGGAGDASSGSSGGGGGGGPGSGGVGGSSSG